MIGSSQNSMASNALNSEFAMLASPIRLSLAAKGLQRLQDVKPETDFPVVLRDERYRCPLFVGEFLSPE
jgi:hypothetical protein